MRGHSCRALAPRELLIGDEAYSGKGPIAALSIEALRYVEALGDLTVQEMTVRLYGFGRRPVTSAQKRAFHDAEIDGLAASWARAGRARYDIGPAHSPRIPIG